MDFDNDGIKPSPLSGNGKTKPAPQAAPQPAVNRKLLAALIVLLAVAFVALVFLGLKVAGNDEKLAQVVQERDQAQLDAQQAQLDLQQSLMQNDFDELDRQFAQIEDQRVVIKNDSVKRELMEKYEAAKLRMEKLKEELRDEKKKSAAEIKKLNDEISTLRDLLRQYLAQIDELTKENQQLRDENQGLREDNSRLTTKVNETTKANEELTVRMTLAEKLNVTGLSLTALNSKGKTEKKVAKAKQLMATFTIPQNNSTPVGEKTIYMRIISPSGQLLGNDGTFTFEGASVPCTARKIIEYAGIEIANIHIYWDVNTALVAGDYTVELFADNFRLVSRSFTLK